jgi:hypothetical protein
MPKTQTLEKQGSKMFKIFSCGKYTEACMGSRYGRRRIADGSTFRFGNFQAA